MVWWLDAGVGGIGMAEDLVDEWTDIKGEPGWLLRSLDKWQQYGGANNDDGQGVIF